MSRKRKDRVTRLFGYTSKIDFKPGLSLKIRGRSWVPVVVVVVVGTALLLMWGVHGMKRAGPVRLWNLIPIGVTALALLAVIWGVFLRRATNLRPHKVVFDLRRKVLVHQVFLRERVIPLSALRAVTLAAVGTRGSHSSGTLFRCILELRLAGKASLGLAVTRFHPEIQSAIERGLPLAELLERELGLKVECRNFDRQE